MAEAKSFSYSLKDIVELLVRERGLTEGFWGPQAKFAFHAANVASPATPGEMYPSAIVPLVEFGIQRFDEPNAFTVDAATLEPKPPK